MKPLKIFFSRKKNIIKWKYLYFIILIMVILLAVWTVRIIFGPSSAEKVFLEQSIYCESDQDCQLYNCTSCGNKLWIEKNNVSVGECKNKVPGLVGCVCLESVCKRKYEK